MSDNIQIKRWETTFFGETVNFWSIMYRDEFYFFAREVATSLGFKNPMDAIYKHVDSEDLTSLSEVFGENFKSIFDRYFQSVRKTRTPSFFRNLQGKQSLFNEFGIYALCLGSKLERLRPFRRWVYQTITTIRRTGSYNPPASMFFDNPLDMISQIVSSQIPEYKEGGDNSLRKAICKKLKEGYDLAKNPYQVKAGRKGGKETQKRVRELKDSFEKLKERVEKSIKRVESEIEALYCEINSDNDSRSSSYSNLIKPLKN